MDDARDMTCIRMRHLPHLPRCWVCGPCRRLHAANERDKSDHEPDESDPLAVVQAWFAPAAKNWEGVDRDKELADES